MRRYFRGPVFWVVVVLVAVLVGAQLLSASGGYKKVDTSVAIAQIQNGNVKLGDEHRHRPDDPAGPEERGRRREKIQAQYVEANGDHDRPGPARQGRAVRRPDPAAEHLAEPAGQPAADRDHRRPVLLPDEQHAGRRLAGHELRQVPRQARVQGHAEDHVRRRRRRRRGGRGAPGDQGVPAGAGEVPGRRREDPQGRPAVRPARHRQDAAGPRGRRRGRRALLLDLRLRLRRDVRRRRRLPRARPVRAGQGERARDRVRRRDRRRRPAPRRRASAAATTSASRR